jgi:hypothetical protein
MIIGTYRLCCGLFLGIFLAALDGEAGAQVITTVFSGLGTHVIYQNLSSHQLLFSMSLPDNPLNQTIRACISRHQTKIRNTSLRNNVVKAGLYAFS